jgi:Domain of unknown function (DUF4383)
MNARRDLFETQWPFTPVQWAALIGALAILTWSVPGLILNPDFSTGSDASARQVLGADMNGWHAVSGFIVAIPALILAARPHLAARYLPLAAAGLTATAFWALASTSIAGLFYFPHHDTDALLHFGTSAVFVAGAAHYFLAQRQAQAA